MSLSVTDAVAAFRRGEVVAFPTETFFGLACDPSHPEAVKTLLELKGRDLGSGVPLIIDDSAQIETLLEESVPVGELRRRLAVQFWPGPLTIIVQPSSEWALRFQPGIRAADGSVALRVSSHPIARTLAKALGGPITATSANPHGAEPPLRSEEVRAYFPDLALISDVNNRSSGANMKPSTILDVRTMPFKIVRHGAVAENELREYLTNA
jgi:L-threonylcarbamoyladenylate synthase